MSESVQLMYISHLESEYPKCREGWAPEPVRVSLEALSVAKGPWLCVPEECLGAVLFPLEKAYRSPYRQLAGHLTGWLTGHELVGTNLW